MDDGTMDDGTMDDGTMDDGRWKDREIYDLDDLDDLIIL
jgi:hypothetical protein